MIFIDSYIHSFIDVVPKELPIIVNSGYVTVSSVKKKLEPLTSVTR